MRTYLDCYPCLLRQGLEAARRRTADAGPQKLLLDSLMAILRAVDLRCTPPEIAARVHDRVRRLLGDEDPYREFKENTTREALALYPRLRELLRRAEDRLETAVRLSIAGNILDAGLTRTEALWTTVERALSLPLPATDMAALRRALAAAPRLLYLGDNAGETVFDRLLIETLELPVAFAAKASPVLNDATVQDARAAGLERAARLLSTGSGAPGTILSLCSEEFRRAYAEAPLVIAKGQANYETLSEEGPRVFFLLQAKCPVIARDLGVPVGSMVVRQGGGAGRSGPPAA